MTATSPTSTEKDSTMTRETAPPASPSLEHADTPSTVSTTSSTALGAMPQKDSEAKVEDLPLLARLLNHLLTPGSSLTPIVWISFNVIMACLTLLWLSFAFTFPDNIHVWVFGFLGLGLAGSTNWMMYIIFRSGLDFASQKLQEQQEKKKKNTEKEQNKEEVEASKEGPTNTVAETGGTRGAATRVRESAKKEQ